MSITEAEQVFGGVHEAGLNDLLRAFFTARPRHLHYGSPGFVPATSVAATRISTIPFPGVPGGMEWQVRLAVPEVDLFPQTDGLPPELAMGTGQVAVRTSVELCVGCDSERKGDDRPKPEDHIDHGGHLTHTHGHHRDHRPDDERPNDERPKPVREHTCFEVRLFALGHVESSFGPGGGSVIVVPDSVEIVDIEPNGLESVIECLMLQILQAVLADVRLPLRALRAGAFSLNLVRGPEISDDSVKVYGNL